VHLSEDYTERVLGKLMIISPPTMPSRSQLFDGQHTINVFRCFSVLDLRFPVPFGTVVVFPCNIINETLQLAIAMNGNWAVIRLWNEGWP